MWSVYRALGREIAETFGAALLVLVLVLMSGRAVRLLAAVAEGELPRETLLAMLGYKLLAALAVLVPAALFFAVLAACGRWYRDHEMVILAMAGIGPLHLLGPVGAVALPAALLAGGLSLAGAPWAEAQVGRVEAEVEQALRLSFFRPGEFRSFADGRQVFYAERVAPDGSLGEVYVQLTDGSGIARVVAQSAQQRVEAASGDDFLVLRNGRRYDGEPAAAGFRVTAFEEYGVRIARPQPPARPGGREARTTRELLTAQSPRDGAELQWRLSMPLAALLLAALAVPLSRSTPRAGRAGGLVLALVVYLLYNNLLSMSQSWTAVGRLPVWVGLWWVHAAALAAAALLYAGPRPARRRRAFS